MSLNVMEATKNICCAKGEGAVDYNTVPDCSRNFVWVARI